MRADQLTPAHVGRKLRWADRHGKHSIVIGHVYVEHADKRTLVLVRPDGGDLDTTTPIDGNRKVSVSQP